MPKQPKGDGLTVAADAYDEVLWRRAKHPPKEGRGRSHGVWAGGRAHPQCIGPGGMPFKPQKPVTTCPTYRTWKK